MGFSVSSTTAININVTPQSKTASIHKPFKSLENKGFEIKEEINKLKLRPLREEMRKQWVLGQKIGKQCHAKSQVYVLTSSEEFTGYLALCNSSIPTLPNDIKRRVQMPVGDQYGDVFRQSKKTKDSANDGRAVKESLLKSLCMTFQDVVFSTEYQTPAYLYVEDMGVKIPIARHNPIY